MIGQKVAIDQVVLSAQTSSQDYAVEIILF